MSQGGRGVIIGHNWLKCKAGGWQMAHGKWQIRIVVKGGVRVVMGGYGREVEFGI
jgi:hypothetical protein